VERIAPLLLVLFLIRMKVPGAHLAVVEQAKIIDYLLNPAHPDNGGKAVFFDSLGFSRKEWRTAVGGFSQAHRYNGGH